MSWPNKIVLLSLLLLPTCRRWETHSESTLIFILMFIYERTFHDTMIFFREHVWPGLLWLCHLIWPAIIRQTIPTSSVVRWPSSISDLPVGHMSKGTGMDRFSFCRAEHNRWNPSLIRPSCARLVRVIMDWESDPVNLTEMPHHRDASNDSGFWIQ